MLKTVRQRTKAQLRAWLENWTLYLLGGIIGNLSGLVRLWTKEYRPYATTLGAVLRVLSEMMDQIRMDQIRRCGEKRKARK